MKRASVHSIRLEAAAYAVVLLAGACLRLANLGWPPLSDSEARAALAASTLSGSPSAFDPDQANPPAGSAYIVTTAMLFGLFGSSDPAARLLPALAGLALCLTPLLGRRRLGPKQSLALAALLAFSPVLVTVSRQAGATSMACLGVVGFLVLLFGGGPEEANPRRATWAVVFAALALASGPAAIQGFVGLALGLGLTSLWRARQGRIPPAKRNPVSRRDWLIGLLFVLAIATGLGMVPGRAADAFDGLAAWLSGWARPSSMPVLSALLLIPIYEPLLLVAGILGAAISFWRKDIYGVGASFWAVGAWVAAAAFPGRTALDLVWVAIPGAYLAARALVTLAETLLSGRDWLRFAGMASAYLVLAAFIGLQLTGYASGLGVELAILDPAIRLGIILVAVLIWVVLVVLFGTGWSWEASGTALGVSIFAVLSAMSIAAVVRLNFVRQAAEAGQLWQSRVSAVGLHELAFSLDFLSRAYRDDPGGLTISLQEDAPPSLAWTIRQYGEPAPGTADQAPPVVLAPAEAQPELRADYLGQRLVLAETNDWNGALPPEVLSWWVLHRAPVAFDDWVLLVRADVATQGGLTALGSETEP